jgi:hypothetical protein
MSSFHKNRRERLERGFAIASVDSSGSKDDVFDTTVHGSTPPTAAVASVSVAVEFAYEPATRTEPRTTWFEEGRDLTANVASVGART